MKKRLSLFIVTTLLLAGGCAPKNWNYEEDGPYDPFEDANRASYNIQKDLISLIPSLPAIDTESPAALRSFKWVYDKVISPIRTVFGNFFSNQISGEVQH